MIGEINFVQSLRFGCTTMNEIKHRIGMTELIWKGSVDYRVCRLKYREIDGRKTARNDATVKKCEKIELVFLIEKNMFARVYVLYYK